jgi:hypothetical protein
MENNHNILKRWIIWEAVGLEISFYKRLQQKFCPETIKNQHKFVHYLHLVGAHHTFVGAHHKFVGAHHKFVGAHHKFVGAHHKFVGAHHKFVGAHHKFVGA